MSETRYTVGDEGQPFTYSRTDEGDDPVSLLGQTITVVFQSPAGVLKTRTASNASDNFSSTYLLDALDFDEVGVWFYEFHETGISYTATTKPIAIYVAPRVDGT